MKTLRITTLLIFSLFFIACDKPNPEPEKIDPIYADIQARLGAVTSQIKSAEKDLEDNKKEFEKVVPQTGQIKFAQKRVDDSDAALKKLQQMQLYWELKLKTRKNWAREQYLKAYNKKEAWPDPKEYEEYIAQKKLEEAPTTWDAKKRVSEYSKPPPAPKKEGGGH